MTESNCGTGTVAVIGAGIIGCAVAWTLTRSGRRVLLLDRAEPATAGASFGNVGHIATEQVQPLPSPHLLLHFWRELFAFGGPVDIPARRLITLAPWLGRFAAAAFRQKDNARYFDPLVRGAADALERLLDQVGRRDLLRRHGHYAVWLGPNSVACAAQERHQASTWEVTATPAPPELLRAIAAAAASARPAGLRTPEPAAGLWYPGSAHVLDPAQVAGALLTGALQKGATLQRADVRSVTPAAKAIEISTEGGTLLVGSAVICAGVWSPPFVAPFGLRAPIEAERGYHVELPDHPPLADAPLMYGDYRVAVTPMASRLRASSYLEFAGLGAAPDPRKPARLRSVLRRLGYQCDPEGPSWMGPRPTLPDYLPAIGRAPGPLDLFYAFGHQHLGLTLSAVTAELIADLLAAREPRFDVSAFDLRRFGSSRGSRLSSSS
ncbi:MAG TPA: FAD-binding oxidoreductase [Steroidobacteraceae bacterium]|nr:FAD-binding oxidoreductase [Steroidobacteraceae bacterium]